MLGSSAVAFTVALLAVASPSTATTVELKKRDLGLINADGSVCLESLKVEASRLYKCNRKNWRYHAYGEDPTTRSSRLKRGTITLSSPEYAVWTGKIQIGTPAQTFDIYFDTGSSDFTVASTSCPSSSCGTKDRYNVAASSSAVTTSTTITTNFVDGSSSSGTLVHDTVVGGALTATEQDVIAASSLSSTVSDIPSDGLYAHFPPPSFLDFVLGICSAGTERNEANFAPTRIMGLAYPALSQAFSSSLPFTLYSQSQGGRPQWFGMRLSNTAVSQLTFGGYNRARVAGSVKWFNVKLETGAQFRTYWQIGASAPYVNGVQAVSSRTNHILDSGTTLVVAPPSAAAEFWASVPNSAVYDSNFWTYPCNSPPNVEFSFARQTLKMFGIAADDFNLGYLPEDNSRCVGAVIAQNLGLGSSWILGDAFLTSWYIIHDVANNLIGIAPPR
ncbi:hypothetical protein JCM10213v2_002282 [Rhodosporidiobolus nylandii]